jgi:uncharacterized protein with GYD domain
MAMAQWRALLSEGRCGGCCLDDDGSGAGGGILSRAADVRLHDLTLKEVRMPLFIMSMNFTDQGIRNIKDGPKRAKASRELANKLGVEVKELYMTSGESDLVVILDTPNGDNVAKYALALGSQGNVRTRTARAWTDSEYVKLVSELP